MSNTKDAIKFRVDEVRRLTADGLPVKTIATILGLAPSSVTAIACRHGIRRPYGQVSKARKETAERHNDMRVMSREGYSPAQIADTVGITITACRKILKAQAISNPATDLTVNNVTRPRANQIITRIATELEYLVGDLEYIDVANLDQARLPVWVQQLQTSTVVLSRFVRQLRKGIRYVETAKGGTVAPVDESNQVVETLRGTN